MTLRWSDIKGHLPPEMRREIEAREGKKPRKARERERPREPDGGVAPGVKVTGPGEGWRFRKCEWCKTEFLAAPEIRCPIECEGSRGVKPGRAAARPGERDGRGKAR